MKKRIALSLILIIPFQYLFSQNRNTFLDFNVFYKYDKYPTFSNNINVISNYQLSIIGVSWGINGNIKKEILKNIIFESGIGYYKYSFNKIKSQHPTFGIGKQRSINYPTTLGISLYTDKYWYNTANFNIGIGRKIKLSKKYHIETGFNVSNFFTYSQHYKIPVDNSFIPPALRIENDYKLKNKSYFGSSIFYTISVFKSINKISIGPNLILPIYEKWKLDNIFPTENISSSRNKWLKGISGGVKISYSLNKKSKL